VVDSVINLSGKWRGPAGDVEISVNPPSSIKISRFDLGSPIAFGIILNSSTITVTFTPQNQTFTGRLEPPNTIKWSNGTVWTKVTDVRQFLETGEWKHQGGPNNIRAQIFVKSSSISINMRDFGRPDAHGKIISDSINDPSIEITFPDDKTYTAKLRSNVRPNNIIWSNGTVWERFIPEG
jgi:hypothetical protein